MTEEHGTIEVFSSGRLTVADKLRSTVPDRSPTHVGEFTMTDRGKPVIIVSKCPPDLLARLRWAALEYKMTTTLRATGTRNRSAVFGFASRNAVLRREGCRECGGSIDSPGPHSVLTDAAHVFSEMLQEFYPERSASDRLIVDSQVLPEWHMAGSQWTSGVLNETSQLPYHYDANNLPTWNAMVVIRRGTRGGHFSVPEYGVVLDCQDGDVVFMPAYKTLHGVTPIRKVDDDGYRYTAVYYSVARMRECLHPDEEMAQARFARSEREDGLLERQRNSGLMT